MQSSEATVVIILDKQSSPPSHEPGQVPYQSTQLAAMRDHVLVAAAVTPLGFFVVFSL